MGKVIFRRSKMIPIDSKEIRLLKGELKKSPDKKARICLHDNFDNALQEMLIIHGRGAYVRPHRHISKDESISIIKGRGLLVIFNETGKVKRIIPLASKSGKGNFLCRVGRNIWHSIVILSDDLIFHEVSPGPFVGEDEHIFPEWAPSCEETDAVRRFMKYISAGNRRS